MFFIVTFVISDTTGAIHGVMKEGTQSGVVTGMILAVMSRYCEPKEALRTRQTYLPLVSSLTTRDKRFVFAEYILCISRANPFKSRIG